MFGWLRRNRRSAPMEFDSAWAAWLSSNVWQYGLFSEGQRERVHDVVQRMVVKRRWEGGSGFVVTDEMRVTISGVAALMTLGLDQPFYFHKLPSIIVYRDKFREPDPSSDVGILGGVRDPLFGGVRLGEAWPRGPVILAWKDVQRQCSSRGDGENLVLHEFAHHLDGLVGDIDGVPYFDDRALRRQWREVTDVEYHRLVGHARRREVTLLDHYGASDRAEFFAVATECFFERPHEMSRRHPELYALLTRFYHQDPTQWIDTPRARRPPARKRRRKQPRGSHVDLSHLRLSAADERFAHGVMLIESEDYTGALEALNGVLREDPDDGEALQLRALAKLELEDYRGAARDADAALAQDPHDDQALLVRATASMELGDDRQALVYARAVVRHARDSSEAWFLIGRLQMRAGDYRDARAAFRRAASIDPADAEALYLLAECVQALGDPAAAGRFRERALGLDPTLRDDPPRP